jgi:phenylalanyl-tRNA synthetase beta chain
VRVPLPWLREYAPGLPADAPATRVAADLVRVGLEEEAVHSGGVTGPVVVGRVLELADEPQKNGKTIRWCQVDVGEHNVGGSPENPGGGDLEGGGTPRGIVCGAHNFVAGDAVVVALPGAVLAGGFEISARKTYGHVSDGMICSARELGLGDDHAGIIRLAELGYGDALPGTDAVRLLGLDEEVVEINVTPDRGYALSVRGVAREYALSTGTAFADPSASGSRTPRRSAAAPAATGSSRESSAASTRRRRRRGGWRAGWSRPACGRSRWPSTSRTT